MRERWRRWGCVALVVAPAILGGLGCGVEVWTVAELMEECASSSGPPGFKVKFGWAEGECYQGPGVMVRTGVGPVQLVTYSTDELGFMARGGDVYLPGGVSGHGEYARNDRGWAVDLAGDTTGFGGASIIVQGDGTVQVLQRR